VRVPTAAGAPFRRSPLGGGRRHGGLGIAVARGVRVPAAPRARRHGMENREKKEEKKKKKKRSGKQKKKQKKWRKKKKNGKSRGILSRPVGMHKALCCAVDKYLDFIKGAYRTKKRRGETRGKGREKKNEKMKKYII
jgi:hypothetical protein